MVADDEAAARRVVALLVVELAGTSSAAAERLAAVARAVELLRRDGADAEPLGTDAAVAAFDEPSAAAVAAARLHRARDVGSTPWRAGIHVEAVVIRAEGGATSDAIGRARGLARMARPGTTAIRGAALAAVRSSRDAALEALAGPGEGDEAVYLLVPLPAPVPSFRRRRLVFALAGGAILGGAGVWLGMQRRPADPEPPRVTLGVGPFRLFRPDSQHTRIGVALRDALNTELSELSGVKVYSREFVDFLMSREGLAEMEVATRLGIEKMLSGTIVVVEDSVRIDAQIVDVASGILEGSYSAVGREADFLALETDVILGIIARLRVPLSPEDERRLGAGRVPDPDALRRLREAEGAGGSRSGSPEQPGSGEPRSLFWPRVAYADDANADILALLEDYRRVTEARDVTALAALYVSFPDDQRAGVQRYLAGVANLRVRLVDLDVAVVGEEAIASYTRVDEFTDVASGREQRLRLRVTRTLKRVDGRWRLAEVR